MKKIIVFSVLLVGFVVSAGAAPVAGTQRRGQSTVVNTPAASTGNTTTAARAATTRSTVGRSATTPATTSTVSARSASVPRTTAARSAATPSTTTNTARAAAQQKVVASGTSVAAARENSVVNPQCREKFEGCMDSFCMLDNASGGRCICSDRNAELDSILAEIEKLDAQSYKMATEGVERLEMGADADAAMAAAQAAAKALETSSETTTRSQSSTKRTLNLALWDSDYVSFEEADIFSSNVIDPVEGKTGDALYRAAANVCKAQIPECANDLTMLQMMYTQQIKSNCTAYENDLKKRKTASSNKLAAAEKALRETALDQLRIANKYDLGQCTIEFKKCMQTTAGCGTDFKGCVGIAAAENAKQSSLKKSNMKMYAIKGANTQISIAASTMDALESKRPICESITNSCVNVKDKVWDTFVREVGPQLKSAELLAESDLRQNCLSNISECIMKACRDTIDPNDPDGSYDLCLTRPESVASLCRVQVDPCVAAEPLIMDLVNAKLAAARVDSCTKSLKECLTSEDRCGSDYTQCVGLDTDTIVRMCPSDKLVACQYVSSTEGAKQIRSEEQIFDELSRTVEGIMLGIDNNLMQLCQQAANDAMVNVCGSTTDCNGLAIDEEMGTRSLEYKICEYNPNSATPQVNANKCRTNISSITDTDLRQNLALAGVIDGMIYWDQIEVDDNGKFLGIDDYATRIGLKETPEMAAPRTRVIAELGQLQKNVDMAIKTIEADPTVQFCISGRQVQGMNDNMIGREGKARFPQLTKQMSLTIADYALKAARENYDEKYAELSEKMLRDYAEIGSRISALHQEDNINIRRETGRNACIQLAKVSSVPNTPQMADNAKWEDVGNVLMMNSAMMTPFTSGKADLAANSSPTIDLTQLVLTASSENNMMNFRSSVRTTYDWDSLKCTRCETKQNCDKVKKRFLGSRYCKYWGDPVETCTEIQF